ncbi:hypothetical protein CJU90_6031 [Yarrowia sp. C11]|nr:hypothetical protein CJU90_6031 [Yarrowia sp. C11]KAG5370746.1 hypothetical protein CKK34_0871 [Yarrowia sp. E02]
MPASGLFTWQLTGSVAVNTLFSTAFPVFTAIYAVRGLKDGPIEPASDSEARLAKKLDIDAETLYENYSPLILIGFPIFAVNIQPLGTLALLWGRTAGLIDHLNDDQLESALSGWAKFSQVYTWLTGGVCVAALGIWSWRRQQRRKKESKMTLIVGAPEVSLVLFAATFLPVITQPMEVFP